jgi:hypothetical protein
MQLKDKHFGEVMKTRVETPQAQTFGADKISSTIPDITVDDNIKLSIRDYGTGLSAEQFKDIYGEYTKIN